MMDLIQRVTQPDAAPEYLDQTGWLEGSSPAEIDQLHAAFREKFPAARRKVEAQLGDPERVLPGDAEWFSTWYPEAFAAAAWRLDGKWLCVAAEHHDRKTPIALLVRAVTERQIEELGQ